MNQALSPESRAVIAQQLGDAKPATDSLLVSFGKAIADRQDHEHPKWEDLFCLNLSSYMGERAAPVLRRLLDAEADRDGLRTRLTEVQGLLRRRVAEARGREAYGRRLKAENAELVERAQRGPGLLSERTRELVAMEADRNHWKGRVAELEAARDTDRAAALIALALAMREEPSYDLTGKVEDLGELALSGEPDEIAALVNEISQLTAMDEVAAGVAKSLLFAAAAEARRAVTREQAAGESTPLGELLGCANPRCRRGEWSSKAAERGWEQHGDGWLCPQCAANHADRAEFLAAQVPDFFQPDHTYTHPEFPQYGWKFRCDAVTAHPEDGERTAIGWRYFDGRWEPYAYGEDDWKTGQAVGRTNTSASQEGGER
ncbi:hypothetical protein [Streptomyces odonnellii]|uniref:hypothetical protein n=1 Tax=Streptomyces odonnellii TaxID=1417980 RepID=UPI000625CB07|nr:hypothetical protein [Streptomyces odonnellii]